MTGQTSDGERIAGGASSRRESTDGEGGRQVTRAERKEGWESKPSLASSAWNWFPPAALRRVRRRSRRRRLENAWACVVGPYWAEKNEARIKAHETYEAAGKGRGRGRDGGLKPQGRRRRLGLVSSLFIGFLPPAEQSHSKSIIRRAHQHEQGSTRALRSRFARIFVVVSLRAEKRQGGAARKGRGKGK
ncbi:hypothetical protein E2562_007650 [Oryza meyeriana var. granulata]|uniref:Uncharacterized protein n=1 Tax=Oryza meyeriana var. granulata TaxID=110450 RepID=A0A6G1DUQ3_9ORYZ|nr:hypothetical protein E2562_007650 [Oryza meyeriana var. granulata]